MIVWNDLEDVRPKMALTRYRKILDLLIEASETVARPASADRAFFAPRPEGTSLIHFVRTIVRQSTRGVAAAAGRAVGALRRLLAAHKDAVRTNTAYATCTAVVVSAALGHVAAREALAVVLALIVGVDIDNRSAHPAAAAEAKTGRWHDTTAWHGDHDHHDDRFDYP